MGEILITALVNFIQIAAFNTASRKASFNSEIIGSNIYDHLSPKQKMEMIFKELKLEELYNLKTEIERTQRLLINLAVDRLAKADPSGSRWGPQQIAIRQIAMVDKDYTVRVEKIPQQGLRILSGKTIGLLNEARDSLKEYNTYVDVLIAVNSEIEKRNADPNYDILNEMDNNNTLDIPLNPKEDDKENIFTRMFNFRDDENNNFLILIVVGLGVFYFIRKKKKKKKKR